MRRDRPIWRRLVQIAGCLCAAAGAATPALADDAATRPSPRVAIAVGEPEGFEALTSRQSAVVDVYFGGKRIGDAKVSFAPGSIAFEAPADLASLLPDLADRQPVLAALASASLASNEHKACSASTDPDSCGQIAPESVGLIFDRERFRVDLFINPRLLIIRQAVAERYLPDPEDGLSVVNGIAAVLSGSSGTSPSYNLQNRLIIGDAARRLRAELAYSTGFGVQAERLVAEIDRPGWRYSAGAFWAPGSDIIGRRKMIGLGIESQIDTRLDKDEMRGSPLVVFLNQRARVEILRDGRLVSSRIYEAGNQALDTASLPTGSYEVLLRIEEAGGARREERRFFSKNFSIAAMGQKVVFAYAGVLADDLARGFITPTATPFVQAGIARRLNPHFALDATVMATDRAFVGQLGGYYLDSAVQLRLAAIAASHGTVGGLFQLASQGNGRLNYNFDLRHIHTGRNAPALVFGPEATDARRDAQSRLPLARATFTQLSGSVSYSFGNAQLGFAASWRRERGSETAYSYGPSGRWDFLQRGALRMSLTGDYARTNEGHSGYVGISLQLLGGKSSLSAGSGWRSGDSRGEGRRSGAVALVQGSLQADDIAGGELNAGASYEHSIEHEALGASAEFRGRSFALGGDVSHELGGSAGGRTQYSLDLQTTVALRGGKLGVDGRNQGDGMAMISVESPRSEDRFEVLVNEMPSGTVAVGQRLTLALSAYRQYDVRIRQTAGSLLHYDASVRRIGLFPGSVARLAWSAKPVAAMFGRLVLEGGAPVGLASISAAGAIAETDAAGYFQIDTAIGAEIDVALPGGNSCKVALPLVVATDGFAPLGTLICRPALAKTILSSAKD